MSVNVATNGESSELKNSGGGGSSSTDLPSSRSESLEKGTMTPEMAERLETLKVERQMIDSDKFPLATEIIDKEIQKLKDHISEPDYLDIAMDKPMYLCRKILIPVERHPNFNFVGRIIGPRGSELKRIYQQTRCRVNVLGKGSTKNKEKEESLLTSGDSKFDHLKEILHIKVECRAPITEAYTNVATCIRELKAYLNADSRDEISMRQLAEMGKSPFGAQGGSQQHHGGPPPGRQMDRGYNGPPPPRGPPRGPPPQQQQHNYPPYSSNYGAPPQQQDYYRGPPQSQGYSGGGGGGNQSNYGMSAGPPRRDYGMGGSGPGPVGPPGGSAGGSSSGGVTYDYGHGAGGGGGSSGSYYGQQTGAYDYGMGGSGSQYDSGSHGPVRGGYGDSGAQYHPYQRH